MTHIQNSNTDPNILQKIVSFFQPRIPDIFVQYDPENNFDYDDDDEKRSNGRRTTTTIINLTIQTRGRCTDQNLSERIKRKIHRNLEIQMIHSIQSRRQVLGIVNKKKTMWQIEDFLLSADHRINLKEDEKTDEYWVIE